jgi:beta-lactamase superfamily II metal-dependent hydrolase
MKLTIFQSDKGDCLLLESAGGSRILADGGMKDSYQKHVAPALGKLREQDKQLDLVYLSHIDQDHIAGILQLMDDEAAWRVYEYQTAQGNPQASEPSQPRPPKVAEIWHNSFHEQITKNQGEISEMLAASANALAASVSPAVLEVALEMQNLTQSEFEAVRLSRRIGLKQLNIPLNSPAAGKLMFAGAEVDSFDFGDLEIKVLGPFEKELRDLRAEWNQWLKEVQTRNRIRQLRQQSRKDEKDMGNDVSRLFDAMELRAEAFGDIKKVTPPNLASLMLWVQETRTDGGKNTCLLTGDGAFQHILKGLEHHGIIASGGGLHVNVLKGQHHGSENNWHPDFCRQITADHYLFCGNGEHENPDLGVVRMVLESRIGPPSKRSPNPEASRPFTLWFNNHADNPGKAPAREHLRKIEAIVTQAAQENPKVKFKFLKGGSFQLNLPAN